MLLMVQMKTTTWERSQSSDKLVRREEHVFTAVGMRPSLQRFARASSANARHYLHHLFPVSGANVPPVADVLPTPREGVDEAYAFQRAFLQETQHQVSGWKVLAADSAAVHNLGATQPVVAPMLGAWVFDTGAHFGQQHQRIQTLDLCLTARLTQGRITHVAPSLLLSASRFPFYAPHLVGFIADLTSHCGLVVGREVPVDQLPPRLGVVMTCDGEPVAVGNTSSCCGGSPDASCARVRELLAQHHPSWCDKDSIVACGALATFPQKRGTYVGNFGPLGSVSASFD